MILSIIANGIEKLYVNSRLKALKMGEKHEK